MQTTDPAVLMSAPPAHLQARPEWLALRQEEILEPELPIVDPHHHLVDRANTGRYLVPELLADTGSGHNITATVYLEWLSMYRADGPIALRPVGEVEFANGVAAIAESGTYGKTKVCAGIVGYADLMLGAQVEPVLEAMIMAGGGRFRGIRYISASHPDEAARHPVAALYRDLHRGVRRGAGDVREQLPGRQGRRQLSRVLERVQAHCRRLFRRRKGGAVPRHRQQILPSGLSASRPPVSVG